MKTAIVFVLLLMASMVMAQDFNVLDTAWHAPWRNASWGAVHQWSTDYVIDPNVRTSRFSLSSWGGIVARRGEWNQPQYVPRSMYDTISLALRVDTTTRVRFFLDSDSSHTGYVPFIDTVVAGDWNYYRIPIGALNPTGKPYNSVGIQNYSGTPRTIGLAYLAMLTLFNDSIYLADTMRPNVRVMSPYNGGIVTSPYTLFYGIEDNLALMYDSISVGGYETVHRSEMPRRGTISMIPVHARSTGWQDIFLYGRDYAGNFSTDSARVFVVLPATASSPTSARFAARSIFLDSLVSEWSNMSSAATYIDRTRYYSGRASLNVTLENGHRVWFDNPDGVSMNGARVFEFRCLPDSDDFSLSITLNESYDRPIRSVRVDMMRGNTWNLVDIPLDQFGNLSDTLRAVSIAPIGLGRMQMRFDNVRLMR